MVDAASCPTLYIYGSAYKYTVSVIGGKASVPKPNIFLTMNLKYMYPVKVAPATPLSTGRFQRCQCTFSLGSQTGLNSGPNTNFQSQNLFDRVWGM